MLQRGLSNRPTGAVALLLFCATYILNAARTDDHFEFFERTLLGRQLPEAFNLVQRAGKTVDHMIVCWGRMLESGSDCLGYARQERVLVLRTRLVRKARSLARGICMPSAQAGSATHANCSKRQARLLDTAESRTEISILGIIPGTIGAMQVVWIIIPRSAT